MQLLNELLFADILRRGKDPAAPIAKVFDIDARFSDLNLDDLLFHFEARDLGPQGSQRVHDIFFQINKRLEPLRWKTGHKLQKIRNNRPALMAFLVNGAIVHGHTNYYCSCECFIGETLIKMLDGTTKRIDELEQGKKYWVYSSDENGCFVPKLATALGETKRVTKLVEVTLDNGKIERCSLNHLWRLRDGSYKEAKDLEVGTSLMPLYTELDKKGYEVIFDNDGKKKKTHTIVNRIINKDEFEKKLIWRSTVKEKCLVTHHKDINKINNTPANLQWLGFFEHRNLHSTTIHNFRINPELQKKALQAFRDSVSGRASIGRALKLRWQDPNFREKAMKAISKHIDELWNSQKYENYRKDISKIATDTLNKLWKDPLFREKLSKSIGKKNKTPAMRAKSKIRMTKCWEDGKILGRDISEKEIEKRQITNLFNTYDKIIANSEEISLKTWKKFRSALNRSPLTLFGTLEKSIDAYKNENRIIEKNENFIENVENHTQKAWKNEKSRENLLNARIKTNKDPAHKRKVKIGTIFNVLSKIEIGEECELTLENYLLFRRKYSQNAPKNIGLYFSSFDELLEAYKKRNHKIIDIKIIDVEETPLYDLFVPDTHNFALASGVYVHNSFLYGGFAYIATKENSNVETATDGSKAETRPPMKKNPNLNGISCKHILGVVANIKQFYDPMVTQLQQAARGQKSFKQFLDNEAEWTKISTNLNDLNVKEWLKDVENVSDIEGLENYNTNQDVETIKNEF